MLDTKAGFALCAAIADLDWFNLQIVWTALDRRRAHLPVPHISAAQARAMLPANTTALIVNLRDTSLNGQIATVMSHRASLIEITVAGTRMRVPAECLIPVPPNTAGFAPAEAPFVAGDAIRIKGHGKFGQRTGVIVSRGKNAHLLLTDTLTELSGSLSLLERIPKPAPQPHVRVCFKHEDGAARDPFGRVTVIDGNVVGDTLHVMTIDAEDTPGILKTGWIQRSSALAYAKLLGAKFEET